VNTTDLKPGIIVRGPVLPEPIEVLVVTPLGDVIKLVGAGQKTGQVHQRVLHPDQLKFLEATPEREPFDGDPARFRLGIEAARLGLAYEYDPYFSLSISRVDPLPHQLEAVYDYFMRLPRIRFLLADDPGAGKTIMAGLLLKELKIRGLVKRTLIVAPANLCFQWQRELKEKFRESFEVIRSDVLRANYGQNPWQEKNQVITSISWVSRIDDAKESLLRSRWDLVIVDEAHKMGKLPVHDWNDGSDRMLLRVSAKKGHGVTNWRHGIPELMRENRRVKESFYCLLLVMACLRRHLVLELVVGPSWSTPPSIFTHSRKYPCCRTTARHCIVLCEHNWFARPVQISAFC
jgi:hypothetical protein